MGCETRGDGPVQRIAKRKGQRRRKAADKCHADDGAARGRPEPARQEGEAGLELAGCLTEADDGEARDPDRRLSATKRGDHKARGGKDRTEGQQGRTMPAVHQTPGIGCKRRRHQKPDGRSRGKKRARDACARDRIGQRDDKGGKGKGLGDIASRLSD